MGQEHTILFNSNYISAEQLCNLVDLAGFHCGFGEMRPFAPKSSGSHGMFDGSKELRHGLILQETGR